MKAETNDLREDCVKAGEDVAVDVIAMRAEIDDLREHFLNSKYLTLVSMPQ